MKEKKITVKKFLGGKDLEYKFLRENYESLIKDDIEKIETLVKDTIMEARAILDEKEMRLSRMEFFGNASRTPMLEEKLDAMMKEIHEKEVDFISVDISRTLNMI